MDPNAIAKIEQVYYHFILQNKNLRFESVPNFHIVEELVSDRARLESKAFHFLDLIVSYYGGFPLTTTN